ncbi:MAG: transposase, partial [archaeon]|nr:transposase [archaeon]
NPFAEDHNQRSFYYMFRKTRNSLDFIAFVDYLLAEEPDRALIFVLDNASIHNSKATNEYLAPLEEEGRVERLFLPTYTPKYNWIEPIWLHSKRHVMDNAGFDSLGEILNTLSHFWGSLSPDDYRRFMGVKTRLEKLNVQLLI